MNMSQICTSIEQSKKLLELGLDSNTADMCLTWVNHTWNEVVGNANEILKNQIANWEDNEWNYKDEETWKENKPKVVPAWSFLTLVELMPKTIEGSDGIDYYLILDIKSGFVRYMDKPFEAFHDDFPYPYKDEGKTLFDYVVEGVIWLVENEYLKI